MEQDLKLESNKIYIVNETNNENLNHFILLLNYDLANIIRNYYEQNNQIQPSNYLDSSYNLFKNTIKEILDQNQNATQSMFIKLHMPIQLVCNILTCSTSMNSSSFISSQSMQSSFNSINLSTAVSHKVLVDILILFWESYFCKHLNSTFTIQSNLSSSFNLSFMNEYKMIMQIVNQTICGPNDSDDQTKSNNIYHLFLRYLYLNLKDNTFNSNSSFNTSNSSNIGATNTVWRTFKGRLYTRLHDKRIAELDMNGYINLSYLFFVLIKSFSNSISMVVNQLKYEQVESFFRLMNVFIKSKNLNKIESILSSSSSSSLNAIKTIFNTKFVCLRLWLETNELVNDQTNNLNNNEEIEMIIKQEFINAINSWLTDSANLLNVNPSSATTSSNQINSYKNSQTATQFICDGFMNYLDNCKYFLNQLNDLSERVNSQSFLFQLTLITCKLINEIKYDILLKILSRKQSEMIFAKLIEIFSVYKRMLLSDLSSYSLDSKLTNIMMDIIQKIWPLSLHTTSNTSNVFSYETTANFYFEMCSLYSYLFYNPKSLVNNQTKEMKNLLDMIENISFTSPNTNDDSTSQLIIVRLKFLNNILRDNNLYEICEKNLLNFEYKLMNFFIHTYLNNANISLVQSSNSDISVNTTANSNASGSGQSTVEKEFFQFVELLTQKLNLFTELNMNKFDSQSSNNLEEFLNEFVIKYSQKVKQTQSHSDKKILIENFNSYFQDFLKLINSLGSVTSHSTIYKSYLLAANIVGHMSFYLHCRVTMILNFLI